jgi:conjugative relaxase-like TrwC/TraI family protein
MAGRDPTTGEQLGRAYGERSARGYDVTMSAPKSVSVLWAVADHHTRTEIEGALDAAAGSVIRLIEDQAHTRIKPTATGPVAVVDAEGIAACVFRQHTSRSLDPQLHVHGVVIAKVRDPHHRWKALDARMVKRDQRTLSAVFHATLRSELTVRLGVDWQTPVNGIAEMAGIEPEVLAAFSQRTAQVEQRTQVKLDRFRDTLGREPTQLERWRLEREAVTDSRPTKPHGEPAEDHHGRWRRELSGLGIDPPELARSLVDRVEPRREFAPGEWHELTSTAMAALEGERSAWRRNDIIRELARAWPTDLAGDPARLRRNLDTLADDLVERYHVELNPPTSPLVPRRASDRRPVTESTLDRQLSTPLVLAEEAELTQWALSRWAIAGRPAELGRGELDHAQLAVAREVAGTAPLITVVGPAGAGKTTALRPAVRSLRAQGRPVFGVAPSATAATVLRDGISAPCDTIAKLLVEHAKDGGPGAGYDLPRGTTLLVDEAGMVSTPDLARLARLATDRHWRVVLVGDPQQLAPVGRGGMFTRLVEIGPTLELERIHRFHEPWERDASIRLRAGDPDVLDLYDRHGRVHPAATRIDAHRGALAAWDEARQHGSVLMVTATNATADSLNDAAQHLRLLNHEIDPTRGWTRTATGARLATGDEIVTRHNDRAIRTDRGLPVRNRATWTITAVERDGIVAAAGADGSVRLPARYVWDAVELGYAQTVHGAQGATVDRSILVIDGPTDGRNLYVGLTRGAQRNDVYVLADENGSPTDLLASCLAHDWADRPATAIHIELVEQALRDGWTISDLTDAGWTGPGLTRPEFTGAGMTGPRLDDIELERARPPELHRPQREAPSLYDDGLGLDL